MDKVFLKATPLDCVKQGQIWYPAPASDVWVAHAIAQGSQLRAGYQMQKTMLVASVAQCGASTAIYILLLLARSLHVHSLCTAGTLFGAAKAHMHRERSCQQCCLLIWS